FFYTIAINFSHYAYNTTSLQSDTKWLDGLFHKNDGYQTPIVINPYRENGNIDINTENHLVRSRLIVTLLDRGKRYGIPSRMLTKNREAVSLRLTMNKSKQNAILYRFDADTKTPKDITIRDLEQDTDLLLYLLND